MYSNSIMIRLTRNPNHSSRPFKTSRRLPKMILKIYNDLMNCERFPNDLWLTSNRWCPYVCNISPFLITNPTPNRPCQHPSDTGLLCFPQLDLPASQADPLKSRTGLPALFLKSAPSQSTRIQASLIIAANCPIKHLRRPGPRGPYIVNGQDQYVSNPASLRAVHLKESQFRSKPGGKQIWPSDL